MTNVSTRVESDKRRYRVENGKVCIELKLKNPYQIFDARDPAPFRERDLDDDAVKYIVSSANEFTLKTPLKLKIHLSDTMPDGMDAALIKDAIHTYFEYESDLLRRKLRQVFRQAQVFLMVGILALIVCLSLSHNIEQLGFDASWSRILREGFMISGWVAMWKPMDLLLYDWRPIAHEKKLFEKLSSVEIDVE